MSKRQRHDDLIAGLREMADWLERRPDIEVPIVNTNLFVFFYEADAFRDEVRRMGSCKRCSGNGLTSVIKTFPGRLSWRVAISSGEVCERVQVGTKDIPAVDAVPASTEPVYEWKCPESLLTP